MSQIDCAEIALEIEKLRLDLSEKIQSLHVCITILQTLVKRRLEKYVRRRSFGFIRFLHVSLDFVRLRFNDLDVILGCNSWMCLCWR